MQPFLFECQDEQLSTNNFVPCMVYLPVKAKLNSSVTIKVTLKPLDSSITPSSPSSSNGSTKKQPIVANNNNNSNISSNGEENEENDDN
jgi:hypothetical protein